MIPRDKEERVKMIARMLTGLEGREDDSYTEWENDFINSLNEQFEKKGDLTDRQCEILEALYDKL